MLCNFPEGRPPQSDSTSWSGRRRWTIRRSSTWLSRVYLLFFSVQVESTLGKERCSDGSSNSKMNKGLTNFLRLHQLWFQCCSSPGVTVRNQCSRKYLCRGNNVVCTELCKCGGKGDSCTIIRPPMIGEYLEDDLPMSIGSTVWHFTY